MGTDAHWKSSNEVPPLWTLQGSPGVCHISNSEHRRTENREIPKGPFRKGEIWTALRHDRMPDIPQERLPVQVLAVPRAWAPATHMGEPDGSSSLLALVWPNAVVGIGRIKQKTENLSLLICLSPCL